MENMQNEESPSLTKLYDELVFGNEEVLKANAERMGKKQLIEFYEYCVEKYENSEVEGCELYWYASLILEDMPVVKMYKNGQLYAGMTLDNDDVPYMNERDVNEDDIADIKATIQLLEQRKKDKRNPMKRLVKFFRG